MDAEHDLGEDNDSSLDVDVVEMLTLQLAEWEMLTSMFSNRGELILDDPDSVQEMQDFVEGKIKYDYLQSRLGFTVILCVGENNKNIVELSCQLPHDYPVVAPEVFVRAKNLTKDGHKHFNEDLHEYVTSLDRGEIIVCSVTQWIQDNGQNYYDKGEKQQIGKIKERIPEDDMFLRLWIYSHHIYSKFKRRDILDWAHELKLSGFSLPGKPGIICVEGYSRPTEEFWHRIRRLNWKKLVIKEKEEFAIDDGDPKTFQKFANFEEKVFDVRGGKSREYHMDLGKLFTFLEEHGCAKVFCIYFGVEGKASGTS